MSVLTLIGVFTSILLFSHFKCGAEEPVKFVAMEFTGVLQFDKQGALDFMLEDLFKQLAMPSDYEVFIPARGLQIFFNQQADCIVPSANYPPYFEETAVIHSKSFVTSFFTAFTLKEPLVRQKSDLNAKIVGMIRDNKSWDYSRHIAQGNTYLAGVNDLATLVKMLYLGRIDVAIHDRDDFLVQVKKLKFEMPQYDSKRPLWSEKIVITCHENAKNNAFLQRLNPILSTIVEAGMMGKYYRQSLQQIKQ